MDGVWLLFVYIQFKQSKSKPIQPRNSNLIYIQFPDLKTKRKRKKKKTKQNKNINFTRYGYTAYLSDGGRFFSTQSPLCAFTVYHSAKVLGLQNCFIKLFDFSACSSPFSVSSPLCISNPKYQSINQNQIWPKIPILIIINTQLILQIKTQNPKI